MKLKVIFISILLLTVLCGNACAFDDEDTHPRLTKRAAESSNLESYLIQNMGLKDGLNTRFPANTDKSILYWLREGSKLEDHPTCRASNHFHNPLKPWDEAGLGIDQQSAISTAIDLYCMAAYPQYTKKYSNVMWATAPYSLNPDGATGTTNNDMNWQWARSFYFEAMTRTSKAERESYFASTFTALGQVMHLLEDMAVPAHVRNDFKSHLIYSEINQSNWSNPINWVANSFEHYVKNNPTLVTSITNPPVISATKITDFWDTNQYTGTNPSVTSYTGGLAEYTNANFVSEYTVFTENLNVASYPFYFPYPRKDSTEEYQQAIAPNETRTYFRKVRDGEMVEHLAVAKRLYKYLSLWPDVQRTFITLDDNCQADYAQKLIPRAVGYSAGLLNYFFRGQMETSALEQMDNDGNVSGLLVNIKNMTNGETMKDGSFVVSYRYKPSGSTEYLYGLSDPVTSGILSPNPPTSVQYAFVFLRPIPAGATEIQYTLVFNGTLGSETGAVVGKVVPVTPEQIDTTYPERFVYAIADDQSNSNFNKLRARLRDNAPNIDLTGGSVTARAKYKLHLNHMDDLSTEPPYYAEDRSSDFYYSTSQPVNVSLDTINYTEVEFDFSSNPIPFGVTDLFLEVTYKKGDAVIAYSVKDLNEPQYVGVWNSHDRFLIDIDANSGDDVHDWRLMTEAEIMSDPTLVSMLDYDNQGLVDEPIDAMNVNFDLYFSPTPQLPGSITYHATFNNLPPGRYGRVALITDQPYFYIKFHEKYTSSIEDVLGTGNYLEHDGSITYVIPGVANQEMEGTYYYTPIYGFRNVPNHFSYISTSMYPEPATILEKNILIKEAEWPEPVDTTPYPASSINP